MQINADTALCDILDRYPALIPVAGRLGIRLGVGEGSLEEVAGRHGADADFLVTVLSTFLDEEYVPEGQPSPQELVQTIDYLRKTNAHYLHSQLPNIGRHLGALIASNRSGDRSPAELGRLFERFGECLSAQIRQQEEDFAAMLAGRPVAQNPGRAEREEEAEGLLADMRNIMIRHLSGDYDQNLCFAVVLALANMRRDMSQHSRLRRRLPGMKHAEHTAKANGGQLTPREREVLALVAQGMTSRQMADRLFISLQTVLSHRKNITAKLGVKSVPGLTLYALMHGIITKE